MNRMFGASRSPGFTLIELMMVLAISAVLLLLAAPGMRGLVDSNRIRTETHRLMSALNLARSEAILRNSPVSLCPSSFAATGVARCNGVYSDGWIIFLNPDKDRNVDALTDEVIMAFEAFPKGYTLTNRAGDIPASEVINYLPDGSSRRNRTLMICPPRGSTVQSRSIVMNIVGRPRAESGGAQCPAV